MLSRMKHFKRVKDRPAQSFSRLAKTAMMLWLKKAHASLPNTSNYTTDMKDGLHHC